MKTIFEVNFAIIASFVSLALGGIDTVLIVLCSLIFINLILTIIADIKSSQLNAKSIFMFGINKMAILLFVVFGVVLDMLALTNLPFFRMAIIWFYISEESLVSIELFKRLGLPLPSGVISALSRLDDIEIKKE